MESDLPLSLPIVITLVVVAADLPGHRGVHTRCILWLLELLQLPRLNYLNARSKREFEQKARPGPRLS